MMRIWNTLKESIFDCPSGEDLFNPYRDRNSELDCLEAPVIRRQNLRAYLEDHDKGVPLLLIAEAPGPWGCRFSGVPITSERQLVDPAFPANGMQSSLRDEPYSEYSAGIYWRCLQPYYQQFLSWNTVPMHPHHPGRPLTIRTPRKTEIDRFLSTLEAVVAWASPDMTLAVGRKAEAALGRLDVPATYVRHPSQGGARLFEEGVREAIEVLGLSPDQNEGTEHG